MKLTELYREKTELLAKAFNWAENTARYLRRQRNALLTTDASSNAKREAAQ